MQRLLRPIDSTDLRKGCIALRRFSFKTENSADVSLSRAAGWGFDVAWQIRQSGFGGPLVYQLRTERQAHA